MTAEDIRALPTAASVHGAVAPASERASPEVQGDKSGEFAGWPPVWWTQATSDLLRTWGQFSQPDPQAAAGQRAATPTAQVTQAPGARPEVDPPSSADRALHAALGRFTAGVSPTSLGLAYADWTLHLAASPGRRQALLEKTVRKAIYLMTYAMQACDARRPLTFAPAGLSPAEHASLRSRAKRSTGGGRGGGTAVSRPSAVGIEFRWKVGFEDRLQHQHCCCHADPIPQG